MKTILASVLVLWLSAASHAQQYIEGKHYVRIDPVVAPATEADAEHEVVELFWYGCPHCFEFEPHIEMWHEEKPENVNLVRIPAIFNARWEQHARAFYALELMGQLEQGHALLFDGMHEQGRGLANVDAMARFLAAHGIDETQFRDNFKSFAVEAKINRAKELIRKYQIRGVPAVIVDGQYKLTGSTAGGYVQMIEIIEQLTEHK